LPELCEKHKTNPRRAMIELVSSGAAFGPVSSISDDIVLAPSPAPPPISDTSEDNVSKLKHIFCKGLNLTHPSVSTILN
jgi:hypothetical protein